MKDEKPAAKAAPEVDPTDGEEHPDYPGLTRGDVKKAQAKAREKIEAAKRKALLARAQEDEERRLQAEEMNGPDSVIGEEIPGGGPLNDIVEVVLDMPVVAYGKGDHNAWIQLNGKRKYRGQKITCRRHIANDLLWIANRMAINEAARMGEDRFSFYQRPRNAEIKRSTA